MKILIVKLSSLGDIIQCFPVLNELRRLFPGCQINWAVEKHLSSVVEAHPLIEKTISIPFQTVKKNWFKVHAWREFFSSLLLLRKEKYQYIFDFQGNCKSGLITKVCRGEKKIGFSFFSVREWPNILATNTRFSVPKQMNIRLQYLSLVRQFFKISIFSLESNIGVQFKIGQQEHSLICSLMNNKSHPWVMVCPGSKWINKQLRTETLAKFLEDVGAHTKAHFFMVWGSLEERKYCEEVQRRCKNSTILEERLNIPAWQYLMHEMDLVIAVDSSALHLCGTTKTPSFSIFGPTSAEIFKPLGNRHFAFQGRCPYDRTFQKQCPILRSCSTGACMQDLSNDALFQAFVSWWSSQNQKLDHHLV